MQSPQYYLRLIAFSAMVACALQGSAQEKLVHAKDSAAVEQPTSKEKPTTILGAGGDEAGRLPFAVGVGDVLGISVWKEKELSPTVTVRPDGKISMPLIGEVMVLGKTPIQIQDHLRSELQSLLKEPRVTVTVMEIHSLNVYITGEVSRPGGYSLNVPLTVLQLIAQAGGLTEFASRKNIRVLRTYPTKQVLTCDYNKLMRSQGQLLDPPLMPGDTVVVR